MNEETILEDWANLANRTHSSDLKVQSSPQLQFSGEKKRAAHLDLPVQHKEEKKNKFPEVPATTIDVTWSTLKRVI